MIEEKGRLPNQQFIVIDNSENYWGPFESAAAARAWGEKKFPGVDWYDEGAQGGYMELIALRPPDAH